MDGLLTVWFEDHIILKQEWSWQSSCPSPSWCTWENWSSEAVKWLPLGHKTPFPCLSMPFWRRSLLTYLHAEMPDASDTLLPGWKYSYHWRDNMWKIKGNLWPGRVRWLTGQARNQLIESWPFPNRTNVAHLLMKCASGRHLGRQRLPV